MTYYLYRMTEHKHNTEFYFYKKQPIPPPYLNTVIRSLDYVCNRKYLRTRLDPETGATIELVKGDIPTFEEAGVLSRQYVANSSNCSNMNGPKNYIFNSTPRQNTNKRYYDKHREKILSSHRNRWVDCPKCGKHMKKYSLRNHLKTK